MNNGDKMDFFSQIFSVKEKETIRVAGLTDELFCVYLYNLLLQKQESVLVVVNDLFEANKLFNSLKNYTNETLLFPMDDFLTSEAIAISPDLKLIRLNTLNNLIHYGNKIVVTHLTGYLRFLPDPLLYKEKIITLKTNQDISMDLLRERLLSIGYKRESFVTQTGEFAVRGFILDVFPLEMEYPIRIEFFGDNIENLKLFNVNNQRTISTQDEVVIYPFTEFLLKDNEIIDAKQKELSLFNEKLCSLEDYLDNHYTVFKDYNQLMLNNNILQSEITSYQKEKDGKFFGQYMFELSAIKPKKIGNFFSINNLSVDKKVTRYSSSQVPDFKENMDLFNKYLKNKLKENKLIIICLEESNIKKISNILNVPYEVIKEKMIPGCVNLILKTINDGFEYENLIVIAEKNIFNMNTNPPKISYNFKHASRIKDLNKLAIGDYVVHNAHGIGIYNGIRSLKNDDIIKDYLEVLYLGKDKLYVPVERIDLLHKFSAKEGIVPKINKLNSLEWEKTKNRIKNKIKDIADKLIKIYAERQSVTGFAFSLDTTFQKQFEQEFIYEETPDQLAAIKDIKKDMELSVPMDRLLCGDVGYGKTEVAFRAAFKAIMDSKQVLYLCPTTILSKQQYVNAKERFKNFPIRIEVLNRFISIKDTKRVLEDFKSGKIDFLIGTHRILSDDVLPYDLGLLIIDEEQRFGVMHKEKIKQYKANIDVLTLTATPIPRTLQLSLTGLKSLSLMETPPVNRYPVQTYVIEENKIIIKDAIYKELSRNGQVFMLYNRVDRIVDKVNDLKELVPEARITFVHGKMPKNELEEKMLAFINGEYDIMVCTTIIENGIDISNVNTLIIIDADYFGLSQLYQIRGRVGRSNRIAYCYLMYKPFKILNDTAQKRLRVIQDFTELGSGFAIASRDLSIRGAGDILGSEQAGFIDSVGIDLYLKILNREVSRLKGIESPEEENDNGILLNVDTHINDDYVSDTEVKLEIHKLINTIDSYEQLINVQSELEDRYGKFDDKVLIYMYTEWFEKLAQKLNIDKIVQTKKYIELVLPKDLSSHIDGEQLFIDSFKISNFFRFNYRDETIHIILDLPQLDKHYIFILVELLNVLLKNKPF